jgi:hypothetical protein
MASCTLMHERAMIVRAGTSPIDVVVSTANY